MSNFIIKPVLITSTCFLFMWDYWVGNIYLDFCIQNIQLPLGFVYFWMKISPFCVQLRVSLSCQKERNIAIKCRWSFICKLKYILKRMRAYSCPKLVCSVRAVWSVWGLCLCCAFSLCLSSKFRSCSSSTSVGIRSKEKWQAVSGVDLCEIRNPLYLHNLHAGLVSLKDSKLYF